MPKSGLERWKNCLQPGMMKGSHSEEERRLLVELQAKHTATNGRRLMLRFPGRTAKRLGNQMRGFDSAPCSLASLPIQGALPISVDDIIMSELTEIWRDLVEEHRAWMSHKMKAAWRLKRCSCSQSEKACRRTVKRKK
ncbi:hypothetical protein NL676_019021 [Syzygium grande]|nr:hypothetical protein NL676_019021 [Syzygium grande]